MKQEIISYLNTIKDDIYDITKYLYDNPEESYHERKACLYLVNLMKNNHFKVIENYLDIPTSFYAEYGEGYPKICFLCEYDALLPVGHVHGHNLTSAISTSAAIALSKVLDKTSGTIVLLGCPGEYIGGSKVTMAKQGIFSEIDVAMMIHPDIVTAGSGTSKAILPLSIKFTGNAGCTYLSSNSFSPMDASLFVLNGINALLKGYENKVQIDSIVDSGSYTPSLPYDVCEMKIYIRANDYSIAENIQEKIKKLADTASFIMNLKYASKIYELPYIEMCSNNTLSRILGHNLKELGVIDSIGIKDNEAGLSLGSVSKCVPCIHPYIGITEDNNIHYGTAEFASATLTNFAQERALKSAAALAISSLDLIKKESILTEIKDEFYNHCK